MTKINTFLSVFEQRLSKLKHNIETEIKKPKKDRRKSTLKGWLSEARDLRNTVRDLTDDMDPSKKCPHCGGRL